MPVRDLVGWRLLIATVALLGSHAGADELELPPLGFLEYLGAMVEHDGRLMDPLALEDAAEPEPAAGSTGSAQAATAVDGAEEVQ